MIGPSAPTDPVAALVRRLGVLEQRIADLQRGTSSPRTGFAATRAAAQSIASNSVTAISFDTQSWDTTGWFAPPATTGTVPAGHAGLYAITFRVAWTGATAASWAAVTVNGNRWPVSSVGDGAVVATIVIELAVGDTVGGQVYQFSGGAINATAALYVYKVG